MRSSKHLLTSLALGTILGAPIVIPASAQTAGNGAPSYALQGAGVEIVRHPQTGLVTWMSGSLEQPVARSVGQAGSQSPEQAAAAFLNSQATAFGLRGGSADVEAIKAENDDIGRGFVRFQQKYRNVPIIGAELSVQLDGSRNVVSVNGKTVGDLNLGVQPAVSAADALTIAVTSTARAHQMQASDLNGSTPSLAIHDARIMGGPAAPPALVWRIEVSGNTGDEVRELVLVNAENGRVAVQFNQVTHAAPANAKQMVCDANNKVAKVPCKQAAAVANPQSSAIPDVKNAVAFAELTYDFYLHRFNRNSLDNKGLTLVSTVRYRDPDHPTQDYANAFWSFQLKQMVYGKSYASAKDVVGHELSHGFTSFTSNLFYYYQSGAINESLSDIFGELIERSAAGPKGEWTMGEDLPIGAIRSLKNPPQFGDPDKMTSVNWTGDFSFLDRGGVHTNSGVSNKAAYLITDGGTFNGQTVGGIGVDKAAAIYYRVNAFLLQSASDYADLGNALKQSCKDLTGTTPKSQAGTPSPTGKITAANCAQVAKAVTATEMSKPARVWPIPAEAPVCAANQTPVNKLLEKFETAPANFKLVPSDGHWFLVDSYSASNKFSVGAGGTGQFDTNLASKAPSVIPAHAFLRFAHFYNLRSGTAGGVVEYKIGAAGAWTRVPPAMFLNNPYNATLNAGISSVLSGQKAFSGFSGGWTSSRINLASLAGKNVSFRFRVATDPQGAIDSWILDNVQMYTCKAGKAAEVASAE